MKLFTLVKYNKITFYHQLTSTDCGAACLCMISSYYNKKISLKYAKSLFEFTRAGVSIQDIQDSASRIGYKSMVLTLSLDELLTFPFPVILYWKQGHFVVFSKVRQSSSKQKIELFDPSYGKVILDKENFENEWIGSGSKGIAIILRPDDSFQESVIEDKETNSLSSPLFKRIWSFFKKNKYNYVFSLFLIIIGLVANWIIPFVFQRVIDEGINSKQINVVLYFLIAQFILFISYFLADLFSRIVLTKFNFLLSIELKEFLLKKLMKLPINFFDTRLNTETLQRLGDQNKIQNFVTWKGIDFILSILNILLFGAILLYYNSIIFLTYFSLTSLSVLWIFIFLKQRAILEYAMFLKQSENNNVVYEFIMNMPEIKVNNAHNKTINKITSLQKSINKLELRSLYLNMYQMLGVNFISKFKELISVAICAYFIIKGEMSLGVLVSISYIIGQLSAPTNNILSFIKDFQDAKISNERIGEIHSCENENDNRTQHLKEQVINSIQIKDLSFKYPGKFSPYVLNNIKFTIKENTITAIVGASGSGKTTLLKLLLSYYEIKEGNIMLDNININELYADQWRNNCGVVLQDGNIYSGTIAENIALSDENINYEQLEKVCEISNIYAFIKQLPMGFETKIGNIGIQLSGGQRQRLLIARALYKNPKFIFLDEATSALDAENEKIIHDNLQEFFKGKTVVIIAHRLSTVKNADQIIVLKQGQVVEKGCHQDLVAMKNEYYNLIKNQLELGN